MFKLAPYSYSKMSMFQSCPVKFYINYVKRPPNLPRENNASFEKGTLTHLLLEKFLKEEMSTFTPGKYEFLQPNDVTSIYRLVLKFINSPLFSEIRDFMNKPDAKNIERPFKLNHSFEASSDSTLIKGVIDCLHINGTKGMVIDWKTGGKSVTNLIKYPRSSEQVSLYALWMFKQFPEVEVVDSRYVYVEHSYMEQHLFLRDEMHVLEEKFKFLIDKIESTQIFKPNISRLCDYCGVKPLCQLQPVEAVK